MRFITIQIPIIDTGHDAETKVEKMHEELDELLDEFCRGPVDKPAALSEMFDVIQVMHGYIQADAKEILVADDLQLYVAEYFKKANELHIEKMRTYAAARGWEMHA